MSSGLAKGKGESPWVQPLIALKTGAHEETVRLGAIASVAAYHRPHQRPQDVQAYEEWLSGPFTKSVRRAALKDLLKVQEWAEEEGIAWTAADHEKSTVVALPPMKYEDLPKVVSRLQVTGTDFHRYGPSEYSPEDVVRSSPSFVELSVLENLTTGKATAQAAHALWKWMLEASEAEVKPWAAEGFPALVHFRDNRELQKLAATERYLSIHDNGLTEVSPKTLTALALR